MHQHVGVRLDESADLARHIGGIRAVGDIGHDPVAILRREFQDLFPDVGAKLGVFIQDRYRMDLLILRLLQVPEEIELVPGEARVVGTDAEEVLQAPLGEGGGGGIRADIRDLEPLGRLACRLRHGALVRADHPDECGQQEDRQRPHGLEAAPHPVPDRDGQEERGQHQEEACLGLHRRPSASSSPSSAAGRSPASSPIVVLERSSRPPPVASRSCPRST